jgi:hypothetical protein
MGSDILQSHVWFCHGDFGQLVSDSFASYGAGKVQKSFSWASKSSILVV